SAADRMVVGGGVEGVGRTGPPHGGGAVVGGAYGVCCAWARVPRRPALGLACRRRARCQCRLPATVLARPPGTLAGRSADPASSGAAAPLSSETARYDDGPQPVADLGRPADRIHDLARNPISPNQVIAGRFCVQGAIIFCDRDNLGRIGAEALSDKLGGSHLHERRGDRQSVLRVILRAVETAPRWSLRGNRLNGGDLV